MMSDKESPETDFNFRYGDSELRMRLVVGSETGHKPLCFSQIKYFRNYIKNTRQKKLILE